MDLDRFCMMIKRDNEIYCKAMRLDMCVPLQIASFPLHLRVPFTLNSNSFSIPGSTLLRLNAAACFLQTRDGRSDLTNLEMDLFDVRMKHSTERLADNEKTSGWHRNILKPACLPITIIIIFIAMVIMFSLLNEDYVEGFATWKEEQQLCLQQDCRAHLVESIPEGMTYPATEKMHLSTYEVWLELLQSTQVSLHATAFYWTLRAKDMLTDDSDAQGTEIYNTLERVGRERQVLLVQNLGTESTMQESVLLQRQGWVLARLLVRIFLQHLFKVWQKSEVKEMGFALFNCSCLARDLDKIFQVYWHMGYPGTVLPKVWPPKYTTFFNFSNPARLRLNGVPSEVYFSSSPKQFCSRNRQSDISALLEVINSAKRFVNVAVMDYMPVVYYAKPSRYWGDIDDALRAAAYDRKIHIIALQKLFTIPSYTERQAKIPFSRVNHNKYVVTENTAYIEEEHVYDALSTSRRVSLSVPALVFQSLETEILLCWHSHGPLSSKSAGKMCSECNGKQTKNQATSLTKNVDQWTYITPKYSSWQFNPPEFLKVFTDLRATFGASVTLDCLLIGRPRPKVTWLFNDKPVEFEDVDIFDTADSCRLVIRRLCHHHIGQYAVIAENEATFPMGWYMTELFQSSSTSKKCMRLLPHLAKGDNTQQVVLANQNGVVWCLRWKKQPLVEFKTFPGPRIDALTLGGEEDVGADKIFFASGSVVNGYNRRGKHFLAFETNKTDLINCIAIHGVEMVLCSTHTMTHYHDCTETFHYLSDDAILDVACFETAAEFNDGRELSIVLACENHSFKLLCGKHLVAEIEISAAPNILYLTLMKEESQELSEERLLVYGTFAGSIGEIAVDSSHIENKWELPSPNGNAVVNAIECHDLKGDGSLSLLAGRDDGIIEIYHYIIGQGITLIDCVKCPGNVVALQCGYFTTTTKQDILACTYSGKLLAWTMDEPFASSEKDESAGVLEAKFGSLRAEIDKLREEVKSKRAEYVMANQQKAAMSRLPIFPIEERLFLNDQDTVHQLSMELPVSIDWVLLRSEVAIDLLDAKQNSAIFSPIASEGISSDALMATYRCQANMTRFEMSMRTIEGKYGNLELYVCPRTSPTVCQLRAYPIKALSLHRRTLKFDESRPQNKLSVKGKFGLFEAYDIITFCLPGMAEQPPETEEISCCFVSCFTGTQLQISCRQNEITALSDNLSTITILQDVINREASNRGWKLDISCDVNQSTVPFVLNLVSERLREWSNMLKTIAYAEILKDVTILPEEEEYLTTEFKEVLRNSSGYSNMKTAVQAQMERMKDILSNSCNLYKYRMRYKQFATLLISLTLFGVARFLTDLFMDSFKFKGQEAKQWVPMLVEAIEEYDEEKLRRFFDGDWDSI
ncbi:hypothetical protein M513_05341 [Trichuris suis]|uniref:Ig-like domain-containing protein n=1 Tax=Trichuris suis TaxID=68888 RepID=A0A085M9D9_9BILA|nr:hypothetical protein M513_05341 [Trichuris suis]